MELEIELARTVRMIIRLLRAGDFTIEPNLIIQKIMDTPNIIVEMA